VSWAADALPTFLLGSMQQGVLFRGCGGCGGSGLEGEEMVVVHPIRACPPLRHLGAGIATPRTREGMREVTRCQGSAQSRTHEKLEGCSEGGVLAYAKTVVRRKKQRRDEGSRQPSSDVADVACSKVKRFAAPAATWPLCYAVGPASAMQDLSSDGRRFEVDVELAPHASYDQRPIIHLGVTAVPPAKGFGEAGRRPLRLW